MLEKTKINQLLILLSIGVLSIIFWDFFLLHPFKVLVVFFHEISHGITAVLTGGSIDNIQFSNNESGICSYSGGNRFLIANAGYLGSFLWGLLFLKMSSNEKTVKISSTIFSIFILVITLLYVRNLFGFIFGIITSGSILLLLKYSHIKILTILTQLIGFISCSYALWDIYVDSILYKINGSDAYVLGDMTWIPSQMWGVIWLLIGVTLSVFYVRKTYFK